MVFVVMESSVRQWPVVSGQWSVNAASEHAPLVQVHV